MAREVELKLDVTPDGAAFLEASPMLTGPVETRSLDAVYFDTPDGALRAAGLSLRIRSEDGRRVQAVKSDGGEGAGVFARAEWERLVDGDDPALNPAFEGSGPVRAALDGEMDALAPAFSVIVRRRSWTLEESGAVVELALDHGRAAVPGRQAPIDELELELKSGPPGALFALARRIDRLVPVRLGVASKAERGYRLLGETRPAFKAEPVTLAPDLSLADAFRTIIHGCMRQYRLNETFLLERPSPEPVHQARVAIRRLRSAFKLFGGHLRGAEVEAFERELKWLADKLGDARDLDVLRGDGGAVRDPRLDEARDAAYAALDTALRSARPRHLILDLAEWLTTDGWSTGEDWKRSPRAFAVETLSKRRRKMKRRGRHFADLDDEARHKLRKQAKTLRYAAEFFGSLFDGRGDRRDRKAFLKGMSKLQDCLGELNDLATAPVLKAKLKLGDAAVRAAPEKRAALLEEAERAFHAWRKADPFWT